MVKTNINIVKMSDGDILKFIGNFVKIQRINQNKTQKQLAESAGLNRWTVSQFENGESTHLSSFIQILRSLNALDILNEFQISEVISPLEYVKLKKKQATKSRVRNSNPNSTKNDKDLGW